ncbi:MAG: PKD domain-containing protein [Thermoplasmata archaeon]
MRWSALAIALLFIPIPPPLSAQPPAGQDWVVEKDTIVSDESIVLEWNLTVKSGATLELRNLTLLFNSTSADRGVRVERGSELRMENCSAGRSPSGNYFYILVEGRAVLRNCSLRGLCWQGNSAGLRIASGEAELTGCRLKDCLYGAIHASSSRVSLHGCTIENNTMYGYYSDYEIRSVYSELTLKDSSILTYRSCVYAYDSSVRIEGCSLVSSLTGNVAELERSEAVFINSTLGPPKEGGWLWSPPEGAGLNREAEFCLRGCFIEGEEIAAEISTTYLSYGFSCVLGFSSQYRTLIQNCTVRGALCGISARYIPIMGSLVVAIESCELEAGGRYPGLLIYNDRSLNYSLVCNSLPGEGGVWLYGGGGRVEGNRIRGGGGQNALTIQCTSNLTVAGNELNGDSGPPNGISLEASDGACWEISGNRLMGFSTAVAVSCYGGRCEILNNTIERCKNGLSVNGIAGFHITGNTIDVDTAAVSALTSQPMDIFIEANRIRAGLQGINVQSDIYRGSILENEIYAQEGVVLEPSWGEVHYGLRISGNTVSAPGAGLRITHCFDPTGSGSIENNTIQNSFKGIDINGSNLPIMNNRFLNITGYGIHAVDLNATIGRNEFKFADNAVNACREARFWTVGIRAMYNVKGPGEPEEWREGYPAELRIQDAGGWIVINETLAGPGRFVLRERIVRADGTELSSNPYKFTGLAGSRGAGLERACVTSTCDIVLRLRKGPDLRATFAGVERGGPYLEGQLLPLAGEILNDPAFNPASAPVGRATILLLVDGEPIQERVIERMDPGACVRLGAFWAARPGWHEVSVVADSMNEVEEVFEENNALAARFYVTDVPQAVLKADRSTVVAWETVELWIELTGIEVEPVGYRFDFGDGSSTDWIPENRSSHTYANPGVYAARGWAATVEGAVVECAEPVRINVSSPPPSFTIEAAPASPLSGSAVVFVCSFASGRSNVSRFLWSFGDGGCAYGEGLEVVEHVYERPGSYTAEVRLILTDGSSLNRSIAIMVGNRLPVAEARVEPDVGTTATPFTFTSKSSDPDGQVVAWLWDFGDGTTFSGPSTIHSFLRYGVYDVALRVEDDAGEWSGPCILTVVVGDSAPRPVILASRLSAAVGEEISFDASGTRDIDDPLENLRFLWDFGDGARAEGVCATHRYSRPGRYEVVLTVEGGGGACASRSATVTVVEKAVPAPDLGGPAAVAAALVSASIIIYILFCLLTHRHGERGGPGRSAARGRKNRT